MRLSEFIKRAQEVVAIHGDVELTHAMTVYINPPKYCDHIDTAVGKVKVQDKTASIEPSEPS